MIRLILALATIIVITSGAAFAETADCTGSCPSGQVMVSFADGNNVSCVCKPEAAMDETVGNPDVHEGPIADDGQPPVAEGN